MRRKVILRRPDEEVRPAELRQWRRALLWTQSRAAEHLGVSVKAYQNWEQGIRDMRHPVAMRKLMAQARPRKAS